MAVEETNSFHFSLNGYIMYGELTLAIQKIL